MQWLLSDSILEDLPKDLVSDSSFVRHYPVSLEVDGYWFSSYQHPISYPGQVDGTVFLGWESSRTGVHEKRMVLIFSLIPS